MTSSKPIYDATETGPAFELIVVSYHSRSQILGLLEGLPTEIPIAFVDNAQDADGLSELARSRPHARYVDTGGGAGFARAANLGVRTSSYAYVVLVNPDSRPDASTLRSLVADASEDDRCASSSGLNIDREGQSELGVAGWEPSVPRAFAHALGLHKIFPRSGLFARPGIGDQISVDWVTGACMALDRQRFLALGGFDERYYVYSEDVAFGRSVRESSMHQILRTDLPVEHASGGSGAPALEMMRLRGASFARYAMRTRDPVRARVVAGVVGSGYVARALACRARGNQRRAQEHLAYARGAFSARAYVGGREVTSRA